MKISPFILLLVFSLPVSAQVRKVLLEEFTTNLCGFCPPKSHDIQQYYENHTNSTVFMTHHAGFGIDSMTNIHATTYASFFQPSTFGFAPAILIDRDVYPWVDSVPYMTVNGFDTIAQRISTEPATAEIYITGSYNVSTRELNAGATVTFPQSVSAGERRICLYVVEDSVIGSGPGWDQKCYDANFANLYYPGQYNQTTTYISQYPHRNVQRASLTGGSWGPVNSIPLSPSPATPYTLSASPYLLPAGYDASRVKVIALIANYGPTKFDCEVLNTAEIPLSALSTTGSIEHQELEINSLYPNPAGSMAFLDFEIRNSGYLSIRICDATGKTMILPEAGTHFARGFYRSQIHCQGLSAGMYIVHVRLNDTVITKKLFLENP